MLILGEASPNILLDLILRNPEGDVIRVKETYSDMEGKITESNLQNSAQCGTRHMDHHCKKRCQL